MSTARRSDQPTNEDIAAMTDDEFNEYQLKQGVNPFG